jgi:hypothetical protein
MIIIHQKSQEKILYKRTVNFEEVSLFFELLLMLIHIEKLSLENVFLLDREFHTNSRKLVFGNFMMSSS